MSLVCDVVFIGGVNLYLGVLRIDLPFYEALEGLWHPYVKLNSSTYAGDFEAQVLLVAPVEAELFVVTEDAMEAGEHLLCGKLALVVGFRDLEDQ
jgi:hypothetical protein